MSNLTGKALKDRAAELNITGRSKMTADELRTAIRDIEAADARNVPEDDQGGDTEPFALPDPFNDLDEEWETNTTGGDPLQPVEDIPEEAWETVATIPAVPGPSNAIVAAEAEKWEVVPNRKQRREAERRQRKARGRIAQKRNAQN